MSREQTCSEAKNSKENMAQIWNRCFTWKDKSRTYKEEVLHALCHWDASARRYIQMKVCATASVIGRSSWEHLIKFKMLKHPNTIAFWNKSLRQMHILEHVWRSNHIKLGAVALPAQCEPESFVYTPKAKSCFVWAGGWYIVRSQGCCHFMRQLL